MRNINLIEFNEKDEEIIGILMSLGMSRYIARTISYLQNVREATSLELERGTSLHQPEVSIAMKELKRYDWIDVREEKNIGKGRPYYIYSLKVGINDIISHFEQKQKTIIESIQYNIEKLKELKNLRNKDISS